MAKTEFVYGQMSNTVRKMPENYLVAKQDNGRWVVDPDKALDTDLASKCFRIVFKSLSLTYGSGPALAERLNRKMGY